MSWRHDGTNKSSRANTRNGHKQQDDTKAKKLEVMG